MGMDLVRRRDSKKWSCNNALWRYLLDSAMSVGWEPKGTENNLKEKNQHDSQDYCSNDGQTVTPDDAEEIYKHLKAFINKDKPRGVEKEIIDSFLEWVARRDEDKSLIDIPGFIIR
jgi:hypothetical protein